MQIRLEKAAKDYQRYSQKTYSDFLTVLGLAGMELTFPSAALIVQCWFFVARKVLLIHQCFGYCWAVFTGHQGYLSNLPPL